MSTRLPFNLGVSQAPKVQAAPRWSPAAAAIVLLLAGCGPIPKCRFAGDVEICETRQCRDLQGRFVRCPR